MVGGEQLRFLYPSSRQFPFDEVVEAIVRELGARGWECPSLPGLRLEYKSYGDSEHGFYKVSKIRARDFSLEFERCQGSLADGRWDDTSSVSRLQIPRGELTVFHDESSPIYLKYVGDNWDRDRAEFMDLQTITSGSTGELRYIRYEGKLDKWGRYKPLPGQRPKYLVPRDQKCAVKDEKGTFLTVADVFEEFQTYLSEKVLAPIVRRF